MTGDNSERRVYGLLGRNISYSLSPAMHNAAFVHHSINAEYRIFDIEEDGLEDFIRDNVSGGRINGFNVTVPYKMLVKELLYKDPSLEVVSDEWVDLIGAINTVRIEGRTVRLANTDTQGFFRSLCRETGFDVKEGQDYLILGAGGAGRAISLYLGMMTRSSRIHVYDIDGEKLLSLKEVFDGNTATLGFDVFGPVSDPKVMEKILPGCSLVVNATPIGTKAGDPSPVPVELIDPSAAVYDLVYARETELVAGAKKRGIRAAGGLGMLVGQGALSFTIWTGADTEETRNVMMQAAREKLGS